MPQRKPAPPSPRPRAMNSSVKAYLSSIGKLGGSRRSEAKTAACRANAVRSVEARAKRKLGATYLAEAKARLAVALVGPQINALDKSNDLR